MSVSRYFSLPAWKTITENTSSSHVIDQIARSPALRAMCTRALEALEEATKPLTKSNVRVILTQLSVIYGNPYSDELTIKKAVDIYFQALEDQSYGAVIEAAKDFVKTDETFFPKPGQLLKLARKHSQPIHAAIYRAKEALKRPEPASRSAEKKRRQDIEEAEREGLFAPLPFAKSTNHDSDDSNWI